MRSRGAGNALLALASIGFAIGLLAAAEGLLFAAGLGAAPPGASRLGYQQVRLPILAPAERPDGTGILVPTDPRVPFQPVRLEKPAGALRVFVFGSSAAAGLGFSPNVSFAAYLRRMLERALPERSVEVVNLGIVALSSNQVERLVADACARGAPDLVVVYNGNNEFLEIHAEKYAERHATRIERLGLALADTRLYRVVSRALPRPRDPSLADLEAGTEALRVSERELVRDIELTPQEVDAVFDRYAANLERMVGHATGAGVRILLMTVASNWRWRGRADLPADWLSEITGPGTGPDPGNAAALAEIERRLAGSPAKERWEWRFRRAFLLERLGRLEEAARDYRAAMNEDPHLRRARDAQNERLKQVGARRGVPVLDTVELLRKRAAGGVVGFDEFYDYVHMTPRGALWTAAGVYREIERMGLVPPDVGFDPAVFVEAELARIAGLAEDPLDVREWMGVGFDLRGIADRDLWKYDRMKADLDRRLAEDPSDARALAYRGNARYFEAEGAAAAERDYRAALALAPEHEEIRRNLERLLQGRMP
jgi:tetratricopeptide (TPR) repeat protein